MVAEGQAVARANNRESTVSELEAEYRAWVDHFDDALTHSIATKVSRGDLPNLLKGLFHGAALLPHTQRGPGKFALRYVTANPWERDWFNVGQDLYRAILRYRMADQSSATAARETEPADHVSSR